MGWYGDPDTGSIMTAQVVVRRLGVKPDTLEWMVAFRKAYQPVGDVEGNTYLQALDEQIAAAQVGNVANSDDFILGISQSEREEAQRFLESFRPPS
jgi:hypothetical protein